MDKELKKYIEAKRKGRFDDLKLIHLHWLTETFEQYKKMISTPNKLKNSYRTIHKFNFPCPYLDCPFCLGDWK